jgi:16S rRNA (adenine1518-N6/adenine1519-N6)-dimethyltransferase
LRPDRHPGPSNPLIAEARKLRLNRELSQVFLVDDGFLQRITDAVNPQPEDTLVEIGPGGGFLTQHLLSRTGKLIAVDVDERMITHLQKKFAAAENLTLVRQDILRFPFETLEPPTFKVSGNLPYHITSPILFRLCGELDEPDYSLRKRISQITVMMEKDVADRIAAQPGRKAYNPLSIALQLWYDIRQEFLVPATAFYPIPKVDSVVVTLTPREQPLTEIHDYKLFGTLIKQAFSQRRKTLWNTLRHGGTVVSEAALKEALQATGIDPNLRAEALSIEAFGALANACSQHTG